MSTTFLPARLRYLHESARLLATTSPRISARLSSQRDQVASAYEVTLDTKVSQPRDGPTSRETCTSCGNVFLPGWNCEIWTRPHSHSSKDSKGSRTSALSRKIVKAPKAASSTVVHLPRPEKITDLMVHCELCSRSSSLPFEISRTSRKQVGPSTGDPLIAPSTGDPLIAQGVTKSKAIPDSEHHADRQTTVDSSGRKKRIRLKKLGLRALLANEREKQTDRCPKPGFGLNLADFVRK